MSYQLIFVHSVSGNTAHPVSRIILQRESQKFDHSEVGEMGDSPIDVTLRALSKVTAASVVKSEVSINGGAPRFRVDVEKEGCIKTGESEGFDLFTELGNAFVDALNKF